MAKKPEKQKIDPKLAAEWQISPFMWAIDNKLVLQGGIFGLKGHAYLMGMMDDEHPNQVTKKGAQMGATEGAVIKTLHGHIYGRYPNGTMYLFPTHDDVTDFSKARFGPLIDGNPIITRHVQSTDAGNIKKVGTGMLYMRGARAQKKISGIKRSSSRLKTVSVDRLVFDERDEMDDDMVQLAMERMSHSAVRETYTLSTPSIPDYGVDKLYAKSDQRVWMIPCKACNTETCLELEFLNNPEKIIRINKETGKGVRVCKKCGKPINIALGEWIPQYPTVKDTVGWWISQLNSIYWDPLEILNLYRQPPDGDLSEVMNSKLGMAYIAAENELTKQQVYACCGNQPMNELERSAIAHKYPMAYGLDVQKNHLVLVLGMATSEKTRKIIKVAKVPGWNELHDLLLAYNVKAGVIDSEPETHKAREWQKSETHKVWLIDYAENQKVSQRMNEAESMIVVKRTEFLDKSHNLIAEMRLELPRRCKEIDEFAKQVCSSVKVLKEEEDTGSKRYLYIRRDRDDYRHALSYFHLACEDPLMSHYVKGYEGRASNMEILDAYEGYDPRIERKIDDEMFYDPRYATG